MTEAGDRLARSRQAILDHIARRHRGQEARGEAGDRASGSGDPGADAGDGWLGHLRDTLRAEWRDHPAHIAADLAAPLLRDYAQRKPLQLLGLSLVAGAALAFARPWRLVSLTTLLVALLKSSRLSQLILAAMSAADYPKDQQRPDSSGPAGR